MVGRLQKSKLNKRNLNRTEQAEARSSTGVLTAMNMWRFVIHPNIHHYPTALQLWKIENKCTGQIH